MKRFGHIYHYLHREKSSGTQSGMRDKEFEMSNRRSLLLVSAVFLLAGSLLGQVHVYTPPAPLPQVHPLPPMPTLPPVTQMPPLSAPTVRPAWTPPPAAPLPTSPVPDISTRDVPTEHTSTTDTSSAVVAAPATGGGSDCESDPKKCE